MLNVGKLSNIIVTGVVTVKIEHIAVWTKDIERLAKFYEKYFGGKRNIKYRNEKKGFESYFITFEGGSTRLEIMNVKMLTENVRLLMTSGYTHMAFSAGTREQVVELTERLRSDGYKVLSEPRVTGDGYFESVVSDPDGNIIEITA